MSEENYYPYITRVESLNEGTIPSCARWFDVAGVGDIERNAIPEFFRGDSPTKTARNYYYIRNFIIREYRKEPLKYLTTMELRKKLLIDACSIVRIHAFLESWGLINFHAEKPYLTGDNTLAPPGHMSYYRKRLFELGRPYCEFCGFICDVLWRTFEGKNYCEKCYDNGYVAAESTVESLLSLYQDCVTEDALWDEEDTKKLLTVLKEHGDDWEMTSKRMGVSANDCIGKYLSLPISLLIEEEQKLTNEYELPLYSPMPPLAYKLDIEKSTEYARAYRDSEDTQINNILNQMIELQTKKLQLKARVLTEAQDLYGLQSASLTLKHQQLYNKQYSLVDMLSHET